jgi:hypothetical protein
VFIPALAIVVCCQLCINSAVFVAGSLSSIFSSTTVQYFWCYFLQPLTVCRGTQFAARFPLVTGS